MSNVKDRTEEEIIGQLPIRVRLGETEYEIKPLRILEAMKWREELSKAMGEVLGTFNTTGVSLADSLKSGLTGALLKFPEKILELLLLFAPNLDRQKVLEEATEEQVNLAFSKVMTVAYPFLAQLGTVTKVMAATAAKPR